MVAIALLSCQALTLVPSNTHTNTGMVLFAKAQEEESASTPTSEGVVEQDNSHCDQLQQDLMQEAEKYKVLQKRLAEAESTAADEKKSLESQIGVLQGVLDTHKSTLAVAQSTQTGLEAELSQVKQKLEDVTSQYEKATKDLNAATNEYVLVKEELSKLENQVEEVKTKSSQDICLPPAASHAILSNDEKVKPHIEKGVTLTKTYVAIGWDKTVEVSRTAYGKTKPAVVDGIHFAKVHFGVVQKKVVEHAQPALQKLDEVAKPYYQPAVDKLDEVTKPYQPKALEIWVLVKGKVEEVVEKTKPLVQEAKTKYRLLAQSLASKVVGHAKGIPQLAGFVHEGTEDTIVNTLVYAPLVTLGYLFLSSFMFTGGGSGGKGKKKYAMGGKKSKGKQPHMSSPGKPAFTPTSTKGTSPFRPTPPKNQQQQVRRRA